MSGEQRVAPPTRELLPFPIRVAVLLPVVLAAFILVIAFGSSPQAQGLDPSWTEVLAWGFLHRAQWGRDLVFTYGPLGFLQPYSSYVSGIFPWFAAGQILVSAAFASSVGVLLYRSTPLRILLFLAVFVCCCPRLSGDVGWALTPLFATMFLINCSRRNSTRVFITGAILFAPVFAAIALIKFSLFPLWSVCVATLTLVALFQQNIRVAAVICFAFSAALLLAWIACGQQLSNFPLFVSMGLEVAYGYRHGMGVTPPLPADLAGVVVLCAFVALCMVLALKSRRDFTVVASALLAALAAAFFWLAFYTRADDFHWPAFFAAVAFLPLAMLCNDSLVSSRRFKRSLVSISIACAAVTVYLSSPDAIALQFTTRAAQNLHDLTHLSELWGRRETEWSSIVESAALPRIHERIGDARVDMLTWEQGVVLLNGMNYAPRPVFQSYSAYTPRLARLNESYFLGHEAPPFVVFRLDYSDNKVPMSEDGLALLALLRQYRPTLIEKGFALLQRDDAIADVAAMEPSGRPEAGKLNSETAVTTTSGASVAFIDVRLSLLGKLYTSLFREPELDLVFTTRDNQQQRYRFTRLSGSAGFLVNPFIRSTQDWIGAYFSKPLPIVRSIKIETESAWARSLFVEEFSIVVKPIELLHHDARDKVSGLIDMLYPGFNIAPVSPSSVRVINEDGKESVHLHAPAELTFMPSPGNYSIHALYGIQAAASNDPTCAKANPDGIGVSLILVHEGNRSVAVHVDIDPFHEPQDRGPKELSLTSLDVSAGDTVEYKVDAGPAGNNVSCDWSYVRDFVFRRHGESGKVGAADRIFTEGFD